MANYNKVMLMGNITRDIELKSTPSGLSVADIGLAVNRKNKDGGEETTFVDVTLWGRTAEIASQYSGKGQPLFIEGRLQLDTWQDRETGQNRSKLKVVGENIQLMGGGKTEPKTSNEPVRKQPEPAGGYDPNQDDIPF